jgi:hypothetical protein
VGIFSYYYKGADDPPFSCRLTAAPLRMFVVLQTAVKNSIAQ